MKLRLCYLFSRFLLQFFLIMMMMMSFNINMGVFLMPTYDNKYPYPKNVRTKCSLFVSLKILNNSVDYSLLNLYESRHIIHLRSNNFKIIYLDAWKMLSNFPILCLILSGQNSWNVMFKTLSMSINLCSLSRRFEYVSVVIFPLGY